MTAISNTAHKRQGMALAKKLLAFVLALALCVSFVPVAPAVAADDAQENTVTLTIVVGNVDWQGDKSYTTLVNKKYAFNEGDTVVDLLGYAKEAGDIKDYDISGGMLNSITSKEGEKVAGWSEGDGYTFWSLGVGGGFADKGVEETNLEAGQTYQLGYTFGSSVPASYDWEKYYESNEPAAYEGEEQGKGVVTLTIAGSANTDWDTGVSTPVTWVNKKYAFNEGDTVVELLDHAKKAGDIEGYVFSDGMLNSITSEEGERVAGWTSTDGSSYTYWSFGIDCDYAPTGVGQTVLKDGKSYQLGFVSSSSVPTSYDWDAYYEENVPGESTNTPAEPENPGTTPERPGTGNVATGIDENQIGELMDNIATSYAGTTDPWKVLALSALGMKDTIGSGFVAQAVKDIKNPPQDGNQATAVQRYIIALTAAGYDATALPDGDGTFNAIEKMAKNVTGNSNVNILLSTLWAYASGNYEVPDDANLSEQALVNKILDVQHADGGFAWSGSGTDVDTTAMAICALAPYEGEYEGVSEAINSALKALLAIQEEDGGFADNTGAENANSTAYAVLALCAADVNPATEWATENGGTPLSALLQFAAKDLSGFVFDSSLNELNEMATEQGFMALVAYQGLLNSDGEAYNLYVDASKGISSIPDYTPQPKEDSGPADEGEDAGDATQTSDSGVGALALAAAIAMLATFVAGSAAHRRRMGMTNGKED